MARAIEDFRQPAKQCVVGGGIDGRGGDLDFEFVADGFADGVAAGPWVQFDGEARPVGVGVEEGGEAHGAMRRAGGDARGWGEAAGAAVRRALRRT